MNPPTARDELGLVILLALAAAYLLLAIPFIGAHAPAAPTPADTVTGATAAPAVIYTGAR